MRARQVMLLFDGAFSAMLVHRDPSYAEAAGQAAMRWCGTRSRGRSEGAFSPLPQERSSAERIAKAGG